MTSSNHARLARTAIARPFAPIVRKLRDGLDELGQIVVFVSKTIYLLPITIRRYRPAVLRTTNEMAWGKGSLVVDGGVVGLMFFLGLAVGAVVAIQSVSSLQLLGFGPLSGLIGSYGNLRVIAPLITAVGFAAQAGCRMTAEIGAMRISEEIDATEVMGLRSIPYVVGTRLLGGMLIVVPSYLMALVISFVTGNFLATVVFEQPLGTYNHYFEMFLSTADLFASLLKVMVFCAIVTMIHCYYGYFASGGPAGVGAASGKAIRASLVAIVVLNFLMTVAIWGLSPEIVFKG